MSTAPTTVRQFKARSLAGLRRANPGVPLTLDWDAARRVTFPTGLTGFTGWGRVVFADGTTNKFLATSDKYGTSVR